MSLKRTSHAVYDTKYHLVWTPKYRKWILRGDIRDKVEEIFEEISKNHDFEIDTLEVSQDHVHIFLSFPPRYSISKVLGMFKSISASVIFKKYPEVKEDLLGEEFWEDGYFVRTVGDNVTAEVIRKYIKYHRTQKKIPTQQKLF
ncbi:IS200/IS605 family transposase [bacterium]|nr:IS200/IS605 family transposase [bacterium]